MSARSGTRSKAPVRSKAPAATKAEKPEKELKTTNRPDEWKIEQGLAGAALPPLDMTKRNTVPLPIREFGPLTKDEKALGSIGDRNTLFAREREGWKG
ncbi:hypothetical protein NQ176_g6870 [Zarea fungicola]|uniref:Uncharacterized protein n=1 Tax=Zarea fungicola TaxID=93591 RepID=A0ACC1N3D1_9HYPO|nr:hypothetical protein NQ176_g6870 [Lecanicillium fungicola]